MTAAAGRAARRVGRAPTIRDVAARAQVSVTTVSRVLNSEPRVSAQAQERVLAAIRDLDYVSSPSARALRPGTASRTWGLLVNDILSSFTGSLIDNLDQAAQRRGCTLLVATTGKELAREERLVREMVARGVDGLLITAASGDRGPPTHRGVDVPVVFLDNVPDGATRGDVVTFDYYAAVQQMVDDLVDAGHRRIAFFGGEVREDPGARRFAAYRDTLVRRGLAVHDDLVSTGHDPTTSGLGRAHDEMTALLSGPRPPSAVVTTFDALTQQILRAIQDTGVVIEVAGSEAFPAAFLTPAPLTLVNADFALLSDTAAELLTARIRGERTGPPALRTIPLPSTHHRPRTEGAPR